MGLDGGLGRGAKKKVEDTDEPKKDPRLLEVEKMDRIIDMALKNMLD